MSDNMDMPEDVPWKEAPKAMLEKEDKPLAEAIVEREETIRRLEMRILKLEKWKFGIGLCVQVSPAMNVIDAVSLVNGILNYEEEIPF